MSSHIENPYLIDFPKIGEPALGYISVAEKANLPFIPKRVYWTYFTPENIERGGHAHIQLQQVLIAVSGSIKVKIETIKGDKYNFNLNTPDLGLFIPKKSWRTMQYSHNAVQICIASIEYKEDDYIRQYKFFKNLT
tara:strand:+ start:768 stop:1175 length:408 start_codon:yes stop_codon:yes gene_type:complete